MDVTFITVGEGLYKMDLDQEARYALHEAKVIRNGEPEIIILRRFVLGGLALFKLLSEENPDRN